MLIDKMVRTNWYGQKGTEKKVWTKCYADKMLQRNDRCTKIWDKLKRLIHRKRTLNKLKSIIVKRNCNLYSMITTIELALLSIYLVNQPHSGFELGAAGIEIISDDHYTTTAHTVICEKKLNLRRGQEDYQ